MFKNLYHLSVLLSFVLEAIPNKLIKKTFSISKVTSTSITTSAKTKQMNKKNKFLVSNNLYKCHSIFSDSTGLDISQSLWPGGYYPFIGQSQVICPFLDLGGMIKPKGTGRLFNQKRGCWASKND